MSGPDDPGIYFVVAGSFSAAGSGPALAREPLSQSAFMGARYAGQHMRLGAKAAFGHLCRAISDILKVALMAG